MGQTVKPRIVVLGAGLGGTIAAFEIHELIGNDAEIIVVNKGDAYSFVPSNPWVAVRWRTPEAIQVDLKPVFRKRRIGFLTTGASRLDPEANIVHLNDGGELSYDYLVIATGPELAFDEIPGLGPNTGFTQSVCQTDHAVEAAKAFDVLAANPQPVVIGAVQGASCFGPAYEFAMIIDTELRKRRVRDRVPMTFVTPEPYIGHLGLDGVGDTKGLLESEMRNRHIKWITNAKVARVESGRMFVEELTEDGAHKTDHELPFGFSMMLPAFRGVEAVRGIEGLSNPRGFILIDRRQINPVYSNILALGVCVAIPPVGKTAVPVGVPKTGFMIESMVTAVARNLKEIIAGRAPTHEATWNAICLADFGDGGVAFFAQPQIPPRNINWSAEGKWVHLAKIAFEKFFLAKMKRGTSESFFEKFVLERLNIRKIKSGPA